MWKTLYTSTFGFVRTSMGANALCELAIQRKMDADNGEGAKVVDLTFEQPLVIEWSDQSKEDPVCGSTATLRLICNNDREFVPLMMSDPGTVRLVVSTTSVSMWCGMLDIQQCEEPYYTTEGYVVELTFTDFGMLDRIKFDGQGVMTGTEIVKYLVNKCDLPFNDQFVFNCSTTPQGQQDTSFSAFSFKCENFYDEDGVGMSCKEVLNDVLQPFMMKIVQRLNRVYCYDLKWLYDEAPMEIVKWMGSDQQLSFDKYVNHVKINFSTYCEQDLTSGELNLTGLGTDFDEEHINLYDPYIDGPDFPYLNKNIKNPFFSWFPNTNRENVMAGRFNSSITMHIMQTGDDSQYQLDGVASYDKGVCEPMHITSMQGGEDCDGFLVKTIGNHLEYRNGNVQQFTPMIFGVQNVHAYDDTGRAIFAIDDFYVNPLSGIDANKYKLRLQMDMMVDPRYNPFSDAADNGQSNYDYCNENHNHTFVKLLVQLKDGDGNVIAHFSNAPFLYQRRLEQPYSLFEQTFDSPHGNLSGWGKGQLMAGSERWYLTDIRLSQGAWYTPEDWALLDIPSDLSPYCWLDYYDKSNIEESCGVMGWSTNRQNVGSMAKMNPYISSLEDGQYIPYPSDGGWVHIEVMHGYHQWPNKYPWWPNETRVPYEDKAIHVMYKLPKVTVVKYNTKMEEAEYDDIEVEGIVNENGLDDLSISTTCGSSEVVMPTSKGCVVETSTGRQLKRATRGGVTDTLENLMIGTIYSQFHGHKLKLTGTAELVTGLSKFRVRTESDKRFMLLGENLDLKAGTSEMRLVELCDENYQREQ